MIDDDVDEYVRNTFRYIPKAQSVAKFDVANAHDEKNSSEAQTKTHLSGAFRMIFWFIFTHFFSVRLCVSYVCVCVLICTDNLEIEIIENKNGYIFLQFKVTGYR